MADYIVRMDHAEFILHDVEIDSGGQWAWSNETCLSMDDVTTGLPIHHIICVKKYHMLNKHEYERII